MLVDIQECGVNRKLHQSLTNTNEEYSLCTGNISHHAITTFTAAHKCNIYCDSPDVLCLKKEELAKYCN